MSIIAILEILKKAFSILTNKWTYFILTIVISLLVITYLIVDIKKKDKTIIKLNSDITNLITSNEHLSFEVLNFSNKAFIKNSFSNTTTKIIMITNDFYLTEEDIILRENYKHDFYQ